jgi:hypothetical protein
VFKLAETVAGKCKSALSLPADEHFGASRGARAAHQQLGTGRNLIYRRGIVRRAKYSAAASTFFFRRQQQQQLFCSFSMLLDLFYKHETTSRTAHMHAWLGGEDCFIAHGCAPRIYSCCHVSLNTCMAPRTH